MGHVGYATTYRGAMRIASRNQNKMGPWFYDDEGKPLHDDGNGLAYGDEGDKRIYAVLGDR